MFAMATSLLKQMRGRDFLSAVCLTVVSSIETGRARAALAEAQSSIAASEGQVQDARANYGQAVG